jgi:HlyD family secretion protein
MNDKRSGPVARRDIEEILGLADSKRAAWLKSWRSYLIAGGAMLAGLALFWAWSFSGSNIAPKYITEPAERGQLTVIVTATGTVQPTNQVDISSELSGTIRKVLVDYNSKVKVGEVLAELDTDKLKATVESAKAALAAARAKIKNAEATAVETQLDYARKRALARKKVTSDHDAEAAKASYDRALASVESAKADAEAAAANLKLTETNLAKTCICSPINGVILARNVEPGQIVASSLQAPVLFSIAEDLANIEVQVDVDEADVGKVREGQPATFTVDAYPNRTFSAKIKELRFGSEIVSGVVTYKAVLATSNFDLLLRPGMTATAEITVQHVKDALTVPNGALRFSPPAVERDDAGFLEKLTRFGPPRLRKPSEKLPSGPNRKVWVLADGTAREMPVTIGPTDGKRTQILKGNVESGQAIIVDTAASNK